MSDNQQIFRIEPVLEAKVWGGQALRERYGYESDLENIALAYHVIALPQHGLDNVVTGTGMTLSEFFHSQPELFGCDAEDFPVRMDSSNAVDRLSIQLHPNDEYCLAHEGERGKVECTIHVQGDSTHKVLIGHHAKTREEFAELVKAEDWEALLRVVEMPEGALEYLPLGTLHGSIAKPTRSDGVSLTFETNSDITYRLHDYGRDAADRPLHVAKVIETVNIPDDRRLPEVVEPRRAHGCLVYDYVDIPGSLTCFRLQIANRGQFTRRQFMFMFCIDGEGEIAGIPIKQGETLFVPCDFGELTIDGNVDLGVISYTNHGDVASATAAITGA